MNGINFSGLTSNVLYIVGVILGLVAVLYFISWTFLKIRMFLERGKGRFIKGIRIQNLEILSAQKILHTCFTILGVFRLALTLVVLYSFATLILNFHPSTAHLSPLLLHYVVDFFAEIGGAFLTYVPSLFFIAVIISATVYVLKFVRFIFKQIEVGNIKFQGFYPEWADPTFKLFRIMTILFCFVVCFPLIPGSDSPVFKGVTVFVGVLFSLGSTSAIGNVVAGIILTYMRPYKVGDWVRIASTEGEVIEKDLLVTRIRTYLNEDITIPNSQVLGSHIVNYDTSAQGGHVIFSRVSINYDVPISKARELMILAVKKTKGLSQEFEPFILNRQLHDFYTLYEVHAYIETPRTKHLVQSELNENIQDIFQNAGIEMVSPHFMGVRDVNFSNLPFGIEESIPRNKSFKFSKEE